MNLPQANNARVDLTKITEYLLNAAHPDGATKARFFFKFGFIPGNPDLLADALKEHAMQNPVSTVVKNEFGIRYTVDGPLGTPDRRNPLLRTVWIIEAEGDAPRLITAYPI
jgi:hypothetical protein